MARWWPYKQDSTVNSIDIINIPYRPFLEVSYRTVCIHETAKLPFTIHQNAAASWSSFWINKMKYHLHICRFPLLQESGNTFPLTRIFTCYNTLHVTARKTVKYHILKMVFNPGHRLHFSSESRRRYKLSGKSRKSPHSTGKFFTGHLPLFVYSVYIFCSISLLSSRCK